MRNKTPRPGEQIPEEFRADLYPEPAAGQHHGTTTPDPALDSPTAYDLKEVHRRLHELNDGELKQIPIVPAGTRLLQDATYIDLRAPVPREFTARGDEVAGPKNWYVPKEHVDYVLWNRLIGVRDPARLDQSE